MTSNTSPTRDPHATPRDYEKLLGFCLGAVMCLVMAMLLGGISWRNYRDTLRFERGPRTDATVVSIISSGKTKRGVIEFSRQTSTGPVPCRAEVTLGIGDKAFHVGQLVTVVPRDDSCGEPAVATNLRPPASLFIGSMVFVCFIAILGAVLYAVAERQQQQSAS
jgi:hypothetical protein